MFLVVGVIALFTCTKMKVLVGCVTIVSLPVVSGAAVRGTFSIHTSTSTQASATVGSWCLSWSRTMGGTRASIVIMATVVWILATARMRLAHKSALRNVQEPIVEGAIALCTVLVPKCVGGENVATSLSALVIGNMTHTSLSGLKSIDVKGVCDAWQGGAIRALHLISRP